MYSFSELIHGVRVVVTNENTPVSSAENVLPNATNERSSRRVKYSVHIVRRWRGGVIGIRNRDHTRLIFAVTRSTNDFPKPSPSPAPLNRDAYHPRCVAHTRHPSHSLSGLLSGLSPLTHIITLDNGFCVLIRRGSICGGEREGVSERCSFVGFGSSSSYRLTVAELRKGSKRMPNEDSAVLSSAPLTVSNHLSSPLLVISPVPRSPSPAAPTTKPSCRSERLNM